MVNGFFFEEASTDSAQSLRSLVRRIDDMRVASLGGRAIYNALDGLSWEIVSLEINPRP